MDMSHPVSPSQNRLLAMLTDIIGMDGVLTDAQACRFYTQDVFSEGPVALAVIRPDDAELLARAVRCVTDAGFPVVPRGGGMSYTSGYVPARADSIMVDMARMDRIIEIDETNMFVIVEAGCTWKALHDALSPLGLRTAFWGTLSGIKATVGGGMSQNAVFWGSGRIGTAVDALLGLEVVLADGRIIRTGSWAHDQTLPFSRHYGPDLTSLFAGDAGAMGIKTKIVLRLVRAAAARTYASFSFDDYPALFNAASELARSGAASEIFGFDPLLQAQRLKRQSLAADVKALGGVVKGQGGLVKGLVAGARVAMAGRGYMKNVPYSLHIICEGRSEVAAKADLAIVKAICMQAGGSEIENSIPKIIAANPFGPVDNMIGPQGERWVPIHAIMPHSRTQPVMQALEALKDTHAAAIEEQGVEIGYLFLAASTTIALIEPVFFWPDALNDLHKDSVDDQVLSRVTDFGSRPQARAVVEAIRADMLDIFQTHGCTHLQIGKTYRYGTTLSPDARAVMRALKAEVDPKGLINPGALL